MSVAKVRPGHYDAIAAIREIGREPDVREGLGLARAPAETFYQGVDFLTRSHASPVSGIWLITGSEDEPVGFVAVGHRPGVGCEMSYVVSGDYRGQGYATSGVAAVLSSLAQAVDLPTVCLNITPENQASWAVARKLGFEQVGFTKPDFAVAEEMVPRFALDLQDALPRLQAVLEASRAATCSGPGL